MANQTHGIINKSMRQNYEEFGVKNYYTLVGTTYRNPHYPAVNKCITIWLDRWWLNEGSKLPSLSPVRILDLAAGSGEVTVSVIDWWKARRRWRAVDPSRSGGIPEPTDRAVIRPPVKKPQSKQRQEISEPTPLMGDISAFPVIAAADPYTGDGYASRTGLICCPLSFRDIADGESPNHQLVDGLYPPGIPDTTKIQSAAACSMIICSFALHLVDTPSQLFALLWELSCRFRWLVIISPHKKPEVKDSWGWILWDTVGWTNSTTIEILVDRVHCRVFKSTNIA